MSKIYKSAKDYLKNSSNDLTNVARGDAYWRRYLLSRFQNIFLYKNMPETIEPWEHTKAKILKGYDVILKKNGNIYNPFEASAFAFDYYMVPNKSTFANPIIGSGTVEDGKTCVICWNTQVDKMNAGSSVIWETVKRYARMLAECESTFANTLIFGRAGLLAQAGNGTTASAFDEIISKLRVGDTATIVNKTMDMETFKPLEFASTAVNLVQYCEARDYIINCFMNAIGLQTIEEKKERMIEAEVENEQENDVLRNNIDIMFAMECENIDKVNKLFGTNIEVYKNRIVG